MTPARHLAVVVLATFAAGGVVPRAALVVHDHAGGGAPHVHGRPLVATHRHDDGRWHAHDTGSGAVLELPWHVHAQDPFQSAAPAAPPVAPAAAIAPAAPPAPPAVPADPAVPPFRSRGPPSPAGR